MGSSKFRTPQQSNNVNYISNKDRQLKRQKQININTPMDFLFQNKKVPKHLSQHSKQLIKQLGEADTKESQQKIINCEMETVRQQLQSTIDPRDYPDIMVKLIYFQTLGYDTSFACILPINLCQSPNPYLKKMAYLLSALLVRPHQKLSILMHNTIIKDISSDNPFDNLTALTMLRYFINNDIAREMLPSLRKMLSNCNVMVRKKCLLVLHNVHQLYPHLLDDLNQIAVNSLSDPEPAVVFGALFVIKQLVGCSPSAFKKHTHKLLQIFENIMDRKYPKEYDYSNIPAPWLQIGILKILQYLGKNDPITSKPIYDSLDKCLFKVRSMDSPSNKAILQQCIHTIAGIHPHTYLLSQSHRYLRGFIERPTNNLRYFAVSMLGQLARSWTEVPEEWQVFLVECLEAEDITLTERTISVLVSCADQHNTATILQKIMSRVDRFSDAAEKGKLIHKAIYLIQRFSTDQEIFVRRMNEIFYDFHQVVTDSQINTYLRNLEDMVAMTPPFADILLQAYLDIMKKYRKDGMVGIAVWVIGEMALRIYLRDLNASVVDQAVDTILSCAEDYIRKHPIILAIVISLVKLSSVPSGTRQSDISVFLKKVEAQPSFTIHKYGQQFLRIGKYGRGLFSSNMLQFNPKMTGLRNFTDRNREMIDKKFLITKKIKQQQGNGQTKTNGVKQQQLSSKVTDAIDNNLQCSPMPKPQQPQPTTYHFPKPTPPPQQSLKSPPVPSPTKTRLAIKIFGNIRTPVPHQKNI